MAQQDSVKQKIDEVSKNTKARIDDAKERIGDKYTSATGAVKEKYTAASESVRQKYGDASKAAKEKYGKVRERVEDLELEEMPEKVRRYVRENPGKAILISLGVGFVIGLLLRRDDD